MSNNEISISEDFIKKYFKPIKTINKRIESTYGLKSYAEKLSKTYISQESFIKAFENLGYKVPNKPGYRHVNVSSVSYKNMLKDLENK